MTTHHKVNIIICVSLIIIFFLFYYSIKQKNKKIEKINESTIRLEEQINSLMSDIKKDSLVINDLKKTKEKLKNDYENEKNKPAQVITIHQIDSLKHLPIDDAIQLFSNNLSGQISE